jgi:hypothetical protein
VNNAENKLQPRYEFGFLLRSKTPSDTRTCSFRVLPAQAGFTNTVGVTTFAVPKLARLSRSVRGALVFFGVLNLVLETD